MKLADLLSEERIVVDGTGERIRDKRSALRVLAAMLSGPLGVDADDVEERLVERERLMSTGVGAGVAVPHTALPGVTRPVGGLLVCPHGIDFEAIDGAPVHIVFGVAGSKSATGEHLRTLARISRLLRDPLTREALRGESSERGVYSVIETRDASLG